jgi:hypothetical protein
MSVPEQSPEHVAVREEVRTIQTDATHPLHDAFKRNSPDYEKHVSDLYSKLPGADKKVELGGGAKIVETGQGPSDSERIASLKQTDEVLTKEWGADYEKNMGAVMETAQELFGDPQNQRVLEDFMTAYLGSGGDPIKANRVLYKVSQWRAAAGKANG